MTFEDLKAGDRVYRLLSGENGVLMEMEIREIKDGLLVCDAVNKVDGKENGIFRGGWTFDRNSGVEEDDYLEWGIKYGKTGSILKRKENS